MLQEISAKYTALFKPRCLVDRVEVHNQCFKIALLYVCDFAIPDEKNLDVVSYSGGANHTFGRAFDYLVVQLQSLDGRCRYHRRANSASLSHSTKSEIDGVKVNACFTGLSMQMTSCPATTKFARFTQPSMPGSGGRNA